MAKTQYAIEYLGAMSAEAGHLYNSSTIKSAYPTATVLKIKTSGVNVSVDNSDMFPVDINDENYLTNGHTYIFDKPCIIVIGRYVSIS